jgi:hypothetical protein
MQNLQECVRCAGDIAVRRLGVSQTCETRGGRRQRRWDTHRIPSGGFCENKVLIDILNTQIDKLRISPLHDEALGVCQRVDKSMEHIRLLQKDPFFYINEKIGQLIKETDIEREMMKLKIDHKAQEIINELTAYENECKNAQPEQIDFNIMLIQKESDKWKKWLATFNSGEIEWTIIKENGRKRLSFLDDKLTELEDSLLLGRFDHFAEKVAQFKRFMGNW